MLVWPHAECVVKYVVVTQGKVWLHNVSKPYNGYNLTKLMDISHHTGCQDPDLAYSVMNASKACKTSRNCPLGPDRQFPTDHSGIAGILVEGMLNNLKRYTWLGWCVSSPWPLAAKRGRCGQGMYPLLNNLWKIFRLWHSNNIAL